MMTSSKSGQKGQILPLFDKLFYNATLVFFYFVILGQDLPFLP